jgi:hypothetical protein
MVLAKRRQITSCARKARPRLDPVVIVFNSRGYGTWGVILDGRLNDIAACTVEGIGALIGPVCSFTAAGEEKFESDRIATVKVAG